MTASLLDRKGDAMPVFSFHSLENTPLATLHTAFIDAFSNYSVPIHLTAPQLQYVNRRRGIDYSVSLGCFEGSRLVGFIFNAIDIWNGKMTAYNGGTGVIRSFQGKGVGRRMLERLQTLLASRGVQQCLLEVITSNERALRLYQHSGFHIVRAFQCYRGAIKDLRLPQTAPLVQIRRMYRLDWQKAATFWDVQPSWQNAPPAIERSLPFFKILGAFDAGKLVGYGVMEVDTGDIALLAVAASHRRRGIGTHLLAALAGAGKQPLLRVTNLQRECGSLCRLFEKTGFSRVVDQYEMCLPLS